VAVLFHRFGPYHHARLNAAGRLMAIWGLEACAMEDVYAWSKVDGAETFIRITLTGHDAGGRQWECELQQKMWQALDEIKPTVVVVNGWSAPDALSALWWCARAGIPAVVMSESTVWDERRVAWKEWIKGRLVRLCSAALAGGSPHVAYLVRLGQPRDRIFQGYDIVDNGYFAAGADASRQNAETRRQLGLPEKYFLASSRFIAKKNLFRLLDAYARYRGLAGAVVTPHAPGEIWDLVLLGDGQLRDALNSHVSALNLRDHVLLPGFKQYDELPRFFGLAGAFVHASTTEQWGLVVNEAMASGLPVLVSNRCGCAQDLVQEGVNGFTFDPGNVEQLAGLLLKVSAAGFPLRDFGLQSRRIIADWGPERFAQGLRGAVGAAQAHPRPPAGLLDRMLLRLAHVSLISDVLKT